MAMHELSIATSILQRVDAEAAKNPGVRPVKVGVRIGELAGVDPDALNFAFDAIVKDSAWKDLALEIEYRKRAQGCPSCGHSFQVQGWETACPRCGETQTACVAGDEMDITFIEVEEA